VAQAASPRETTATSSPVAADRTGPPESPKQGKEGAGASVSVSARKRPHHRHALLLDRQLRLRHVSPDAAAGAEPDHPHLVSDHPDRQRFARDRHRIQPDRARRFQDEHSEVAGQRGGVERGVDGDGGDRQERASLDDGAAEEHLDRSAATVGGSGHQVLRHERSGAADVAVLVEQRDDRRQRGRGRPAGDGRDVAFELRPGAAGQHDGERGGPARHDPAYRHASRRQSCRAWAQLSLHSCRSSRGRL
jgi:hypothetical protein